MGTVEDLIIESLKDFINLKTERDCDKSNKLVFPVTAKDEAIHRISEQEARLSLIKQIEKNDIFCYSVETPTKKKYGERKQTWSIDLCLHENGERKHLIEFKAFAKDATRDFMKLFCEEGLTNYFINVFGGFDGVGGGLDKIKQNHEIAIKNALEHIERKSMVIIFLCEISNRLVCKYEILDNTLKEVYKKLL